jgi:hypothetical protein
MTFQERKAPAGKGCLSEVFAAQPLGKRVAFLFRASHLGGLQMCVADANSKSKPSSRP